MNPNENDNLDFLELTSHEPDYSACPLPPTRILAHSHGQADEPECLDMTKEILLGVLKDSGISASVLSSERAERVTRHTVILDEPLSDPEGLEGKLRDALPYPKPYKSVRIVENQPRNGMAFFEIANYSDTTVPLRELITSELFKGKNGKRAFAVGKELGGRHIFTGMELFPNTLVAGNTGTGKSTAINTMLLSLIYKHRPDRLRFIIIGEQFSPLVKHYSDLPHLLSPVITDGKSALAALEWVSDEIDSRICTFKMRSLRSFRDYNKEVENEMIVGELMPRIFVIIDELCGIIEENSEKATHLITRILKYSHATGIYLIAATRSASPYLLPPEILSRFPTRIALRLSSNDVSEMLIGDGSATKLTDRGDMIYATLNNSAPVRAQVAYASDKETAGVTDFIKRHYPPVRYNGELLRALEEAARPSSCKIEGIYIPPAEDYHLAFSSELDNYCKSPIFREAVSFAVGHNEVSVSMLRDHLDSSFHEAKSLIRIMRNLAILEPTNLGGVYKLLIKREIWDAVSDKYKS